MDLAAILTATGAVVTAVGVILIGYWSYRGKERAHDAAQAAREATMAAAEARGEVIAVHGEIFQLGKQIDGRLTELLRTSNALARAEGMVEGRAERPE